MPALAYLLLALAGPSIESDRPQDPVGPPEDTRAEVVTPSAPEPSAPAESAAPASGATPSGGPDTSWWRRRAEAPPTAPNLGWTAMATLLVLVLMTGFLYLLKRFVRRSRFLSGGGALEIIGRQVLDGGARIYLVRVGRRVVLVGATKERLAPLGEIADPQEAAIVRAEASGNAEEFRSRLHDGLREYEEGEKTGRAGPLEGIGDEISKMRETVESWQKK